MTITLVGCGALGGLIGARLAQAGHALQVLQRPGATLKRLRAQGLELDDGGTMSSSVTWMRIKKFVVILRAVFGPSSHQPL